MKNRFASVDIFISEKFQVKVQSFCQTGRAAVGSLEQTPFPRMVDMWFLAMCIGAKSGLQPQMQIQGPTYKAIDGVVFGSDSWRSDAIALLAIGHSKDAAIADNPNDMMKIANGFAHVGFPLLFEALEDDSGDTPLDLMCDYVSDAVAT